MSAQPLPSPDDWRDRSNDSTGSATDPIDVRIGKLAAVQGGRVTTSQLRAEGLSDAQIKYRSRLGWLVPERLGVWHVGYIAPGREGNWRGAVLAVADAALAYWDAAAFHHLWFSDRKEIHLAVPGYHGREQRADLRVHRVKLPPAHVTTADGLVVTTVPRTVVDMAFVMWRSRYLVHVLDRAERREDFDLVQLGMVIGAFKRRRGVPALRSLLAHRHPDASLLDTALERACLDLLNGFPPPRLQYMINNYRADFAWPEIRLILEVDGFEWHKTRADANKDAKRALELEAQGWRVLRTTDDQIYWEPEWFKTTFAAAFARSVRPWGRGRACRSWCGR